MKELLVSFVLCAVIGEIFSDTCQVNDLSQCVNTHCDGGTQLTCTNGYCTCEFPGSGCKVKDDCVQQTGWNCPQHSRHCYDGTCVCCRRIDNCNLRTLYTPLLLRLVFVINTILAAPDNTGKEFIVGFMENVIARGINYQTELFIATSRKTEVNVRVRIPKFDPFYDNTFSLKSGEVKKLALAADTRMIGTSFGSKGILIEADDEIAVFGVNKQRNSNDGFLAFPTDVLSVAYYAVSWYPPTKRCQLMIVGINESTAVYVLLSQALGSENVTYNGETYLKGNVINITINRYDTVQFQSKGDLTGTFINSTKPVAVFSGNLKTGIPEGTSQDHLVEQLPPVNTWGKYFATVTIPERTVGDKWKFIASEVDTFVQITGANYSEVFTISTAGGQEKREIPSGPDYYCYIQADKPILVVQFIESSQNDITDPSMLYIPPVEQYARLYTFTTPQKTTGSFIHFFVFVVKDSEKDGLLIDGESFPSDTNYHAIPGTDFVGGYIMVKNGTHTVRHTSALANFLGYLLGKGHKESYGFPGGTRMAPINSVCSNSTTIEGDGIDNDCDGLIDEELCTHENSGADDDGDGIADEDCALPSPINGNWGSWSYSLCSASCTRTRICDSPEPRYDGELCEDMEGRRTLKEHEVVSCSAYRNSPATNLYYKTSTNTDATVTNSDAAWIVNIGNLFSCAMLCMQDVSQCKSIYFSPVTGLCTGLRHAENSDDKPIDAVHYRMDNVV